MIATQGLMALACVLVAGVLAACERSSETLGGAKGSSESSQTGSTSEFQATTADETPVAAESRGKAATVERVIDGDTLELRNGVRVRLVQIDSPESDGECYGAEATEVLSAILPAGTKILLVADPKLDKVDQYGRLLRYVFEGNKNVNLALVKRGAASVWFYDGDRGRYANQLLKAAKAARAADRGLWGKCEARLDATSALRTSFPATEPPPDDGSQGGGCDASYPDFCVPSPPPDLDCGEVSGSQFTVLPPDPHGFDSDGDGVGCES